LALHHVDPALVASTTGVLLTGGQVGELESGGQLYRVRLMPDASEMEMSHGALVDRLREVTVRSSSGQPVPLALLGHTSFVTAPAVRVAPHPGAG